MAETKEKLITAESLKYVHDSLANDISAVQRQASSAASQASNAESLATTANNAAAQAQSDVVELSEAIDNLVTSVNGLSETIADLESDVERSVKTVNGTAPDDNGNVDVIANIEPPKIVSSVSEMTDTDKQYVLQSTGTIWANKAGTTTETVENNEYNPSYTTGLNLRLSTNDGTHRTGVTGRYTTDYIEIMPTAPYTVTIKGLSKDLVIADSSYFIVHYFGSDKSYLGYDVMANLNSSISSGALPMSFDISRYAKFSSAKYVRITLHISTASITSANLNGLIINFAPKNTVTTTAGRSWTDTGIPYAPTFKTDLIGVMGEGNVIYLSDNLPSGTYTLKYPDDDYAVIGTITK